MLLCCNCSTTSNQSKFHYLDTKNTKKRNVSLIHSKPRNIPPVSLQLPPPAAAAVARGATENTTNSRPIKKQRTTNTNKSTLNSNNKKKAPVSLWSPTKLFSLMETDPTALMINEEEDDEDAVVEINSNNDDSDDNSYLLDKWEAFSSQMLQQIQVVRLAQQQQPKRG